MIEQVYILNINTFKNKNQTRKKSKAAIIPMKTSWLYN